MIAHRFEIDEDMIYLIETLKVEGYWSKKSFTLTLQNKNIPLLNRIEEIANKLNLGTKVSKRILLKIKLADNTKKEDLKLFFNNKELNFHIEKSPFDNNKVKAVTNLSYKKSYNITLVQNNKKIPIEIKCFKNKLVYISKLKCFLYKDIRFPTKEILDFLDSYCGDKKHFKVEKFLFDANAKMVMSAFSALMDCEGTLSWYGLKREMQIRMRNKDYLEQWSKLLARYKIGNKINKNPDKDNNWALIISGWEDFNRLNKLGFKMYHSEKTIKWNKIMNGFKRNQISRNSYKDFYLSKLREINKEINAEEFARYLVKSKRVVNHYLQKLEMDGLIERTNKGQGKPYLYFITTSSVR